ncbi:MAG: SpoIIAA family protein [Planctomycetota bacterium]|jgi:hypothetical protein
MLGFTLNENGVLIIRPDGKLTKEDFARLTEAADGYIEEFGELKGLMIDAKSFPGWENFEGFASHLRFVREHHERIARVAVVTDSTVATFAPKIANHFAAAEIRAFPHGERDAALSWLSA